MESTTIWESKELDLMSSVSTNVEEKDEATQTPNNIKNLRELTLRLLREVQSIGEVHTVNLEGGLDFYSEVSRFEIDLIKRALLQTAGHQGRAAKLLNLKVTTLNSKIKHYNLSLSGFAEGYPLVQARDIVGGQQVQ
ncbi:MAG TPA: helix-turn-helix domain-containing protein [Pyrinomonadaceae bacterium]|nr:helix-turn-helix domain-containing protein [Pyrinomonadaceae bacterium]